MKDKAVMLCTMQISTVRLTLGNRLIITRTKTLHGKLIATDLLSQMASLIN